MQVIRKGMKKRDESLGNRCGNLVWLPQPDRPQRLKEMPLFQEVNTLRKKSIGVIKQYWIKRFNNFLSAQNDLMDNRFFKCDPFVCFPTNAALMYFKSGFPFSMFYPSSDRLI